MDFEKGTGTVSDTQNSYQLIPCYTNSPTGRKAEKESGPHLGKNTNLCISFKKIARKNNVVRLKLSFIIEIILFRTSTFRTTQMLVLNSCHTPH